MAISDRLDDYINIALLVVALLLVSFGNGTRLLKKTMEPMKPWKPFSFEPFRLPWVLYIWS